MTLDDKERSLNSDMLVIADAEKPLVVAGVMGSIDAEVDANTVDVVLESAYFEPSGIRKTSRLTGVHRDTVTRYSRLAGEHAYDVHDELVAFTLPVLRV